MIISFSAILLLASNKATSESIPEKEIVVVRVQIDMDELVRQAKLSKPRVLKPLPDVIDVPPQGSSFKSYENYKAITREGSKQLALQELCYTDEQGLRRFNGYYAVAMGTGIVDYIGQTFIVTLSEGRKFKVTAGDVKANEHTDITNKYHLVDGSVIEFIIDKSKIDQAVITGGDVSILGFYGKVISIEKEELANG